MALDPRSLVNIYRWLARQFRIRRRWCHHFRRRHSWIGGFLGLPRFQSLPLTSISRVGKLRAKFWAPLLTVIIAVSLNLSTPPCHRFQWEKPGFRERKSEKAEYGVTDRSEHLQHHVPFWPFCQNGPSPPSRPNIQNGSQFNILIFAWFHH